MIWHVTDCIKYDLEVGCFVGLFKRWICWSRTVVTWSNCHGEAVGILVDISKVIQNNSSPTWFCQKKPRQQWPVNRWYSLYMYAEYCSNTYIPPDFSKFYFHSFLWGFIPASLVEVKDLKVVIQHCGWKRAMVIRYLFIEWEQLTHSNAKYENTPTQLFPSLLPLPAFCIHDSKLSGTPRCMTFLIDIWLIDTQTKSRCCNNQGYIISRPVHQDRRFVSFACVFSSIWSRLDISMLVERCSKVDSRLIAINIYDSWGIANFWCYLLNKWLPVGYSKMTV